MAPDNSHAERQIARRAVAYYDDARGRHTEADARLLGVAYLVTHTHMGIERARMILADALARRASLKLGG